MRPLPAALAALALAATTVVQAAPVTVDPHARVRPMTARTQALLADGMAQSPTFRALVRRIEASDVIVYIEARPDLRTGLGGSTRFLARSASDRFLRVQINSLHPIPVQVALLGHELQHVVEMADQPAIDSARSMREFYRATGLRTGLDSFDSLAARNAGYTVRAELLQHGRQSDLRMARSAAADKLLGGQSVGGESESGTEGAIF